MQVIDIALVAVLLAVTVWSLRTRAFERRTRHVLVMAGGTWGYTFVVGVVGELGEQDRFRTMVDPLTSVLALAVLVWLAGRRWPAVSAACFEPGDGFGSDGHEHRSRSG